VFRKGPYHQQTSYQLCAAATRTPAEERDETSLVRIGAPALRPSLRRLRLITAVIAQPGFVTLVTACNPFSPATASSSEPLVKVGVVPGIDNAKLYLAKKDGVFARAGINMRIVKADTVQKELQWLISGSVPRLRALRTVC
jgi:hypothetical protein